MIKVVEHLVTFWKSPDHDSDVAIVMRFASEAKEAEGKLKEALVWANEAVKTEPSPESHYRVAFVLDLLKQS